MRRLPIILIAILLWAGIGLSDCQAQTNATIEQMKRERQEMQQRLNNSQKLLSNTESDIKSQVANLNVLQARLAERRRLLNKTTAEIKAINQQTKKLDTELADLRKDYENCQDNYADACRFFQRQQTSLNPMLFLFSSENYKQLTRRARYIHEYSQSLSEMAAEISEKQDSISAKQEQLNLLKLDKIALQAEQSENEAIARREEAEQRSIVSKLQSKRSSLKTEINKQQKEMTALNKEIDRQIQLAIKEAEEAARKAAAANGKTPTQAELKKNEADLKLTGSFESNKGKLPMPITGGYLIVSNFGVQNVAGMKDVKLNNLGIDIQGEAGAQARCIYDGTVSTVFQQGKGQIGVLVRHGSYISVYCNLSAASVKKGDQVKTGTIIGTISPDDSGRTLLHFQLHKESQKLNPTDWLRR